ncbi:unnamed protein product, partial [Tuber aestivum]
MSIWLITADAQHYISQLSMGLLEHDTIEVNLADNDGRTPLDLATRGNRLKIARLLLERPDINLNLTDNSGGTVLHQAAQIGAVGITALLIAREDIDADSVDGLGRTPLHWAARTKHHTILRYLLPVTHDVSQGDIWGSTLLHAAIDDDDPSLETVRTLLADDRIVIDAADTEGDTALHIAVRHGHKDIVVELLHSGAITSCYNQKGHVPLVEAIEAGSTVMAELLL